MKKISNSFELKKLLGSNGFWSINKYLSKKLGLEVTAVLQYLIEWSEYHKTQTIFQTYKQISEELGITLYSVKVNCIPKLAELGFITIQRKGSGFKNYYTLNYNSITDYINSESKSTHQRVDIDSPVSRNELTSESKSTHQRVDIDSPVSRNQLTVIKNRDQEQKSNNINKEQKKYREPILNPSDWGVSLSKIGKWIEIVLLPEYKQKEWYTLRRESIDNLSDVINDNNLTFEEFIFRVKGGMSDHYKNELKSVLFNSIKNK